MTYYQYVGIISMIIANASAFIVVWWLRNDRINWPLSLLCGVGGWIVVIFLLQGVFIMLEFALIKPFQGG